MGLELEVPFWSIHLAEGRKGKPLIQQVPTQDLSQRLAQEHD